VQFTARTGKGAFVRALAHDLGIALKTRAHLLDMRREAIGGFRVDSAWDMGVLVPLLRRMAKGARGARAPQAEGLGEAEGRGL
jgi:tRNA pseudouridine55 synthase